MPNKRKKEWRPWLATWLSLALLVGCAGPSRLETTATPEPPHAAETAAPAEPGPSAEPEPRPTESSAPPEEKETIIVSTPEEVQNELLDAMSKVEQPAPMDISGAGLGEDVDIAVKNLYYDLTLRYPELKYAYEVSAATEGDILICRISYMPYKTGTQVPGDGVLPVSDLGELLRAAEEHLGEETFPICITDPSLEPEDMDRVLWQAGGGYILCALNRDATAIAFTPPMDLTMEECLFRLEEADRLAEEIVEEETDDSMTEGEKALALYTWLTGNVSYDRSYYSDRENMPYDSQTALGALRDGLAICGGYSHALKLLFEKAGIPCFTLSGKYFSENHMWNLARLDGEWLWFDATADRGVSPQFGFRHYAMEELDDTQYRWEKERAELLLRLAETYDGTAGL